MGDQGGDGFIRHGTGFKENNDKKIELVDTMKIHILKL